MSSADVLLIAGCGLAGFAIVFVALGSNQSGPKESAPGDAEDQFEQRDNAFDQEDSSASAFDPAWCSPLGVSRDASEQQVREAYLTLIQQYHPDKVAFLGPELQRLAAERTTIINAAYAQYKEARP